MHISLDGFVAGPNGELDWVTVNEELFKYVGQRISQSDTAMYGRVTYDMMEGYWPTAGDKPNASEHDINHSKWYKNVHKVVLSRTLNNDILNNTTIISEDISDRINEVKQQKGKDILLFGSPMATHALIQEGLIDGYWLFLNPIILGQGIPLFVDIREKTRLKLLNSHTFDFGVIALNYTVES